MASFTFTSPEGKSYTVNGPDGATQEQAFSQLQGGLKSGAIKEDAPAAATPPAAPAGPKGDLGASIGAAGHDVLGAFESMGTGIANLPHSIAQGVQGLVRTATGSAPHNAPDNGIVNAIHVAPGAAGKDFNSGLSTTIGDAAHTLFDKGVPENPTPDQLEEARGFGMTPGLKKGVDTVGDVAKIAGGISGVKSITGAVGDALDTGANALIKPNVPQAATIASNPKIGQLRNAGFRVTGTDVRNAVNAPDSDIPGLTRSNMTDASTTDTIQRHNRQLATQSMADDVGLGNTRSIQQDQIELAKGKAGEVYDQIGKAVGQAKPTPELDQELSSAGGRAASPEARKDIDSQIQFYRDHFKDGFNGPDAVQTVRTLRADAYKRMASMDPDDQALGATNRSLANSIENELMRQVPDEQSGLRTAFPAARQQLAKLHEIEAVNEGGQVNAQKVLQLQRAGAPLSGASAEVANAADVAPESMAQAVGPEGLHVSIGHYGPLRMVAKSAGAIARKIPGMDESTDAFQTANYGPKGGVPGPEPLALSAPSGRVGAPTPRQGEMDLPPDQRPQLDLAPPEGQAFEPAQRGLNNPHSNATPEQIGLPMDRADWDQAVLDTLKRYKGELPDKAPTGPIRPRPGTAVRANREPTVGERVRAKLGEAMQ